MGAGFVAYSSLGRGCVTGTATPAGERDGADMRNVDPRWRPGDVEKNGQAVGKLGDLAATKGITVSQLARQRRRRPSDQGRPRNDRRDPAARRLRRPLLRGPRARLDLNPRRDPSRPQASAELLS
ncbi:hypothetical protein [Streptomyces sp. NBC_00582]|uniref:hypothetical protein n=1 Tax=Streptomyces sp. NBC_00582 TaxID=2975783 RepID=UPI002E820063|nr:hypothetical protein [Streptomyces sp. NBC_00582]WUB67786.1 hypothetical protein OG852_00660 [Streptomyces sp. NBC_00582]WUB68265.1 hypothetical protein OG852_48475 [Streptomyces sp. NBC_00582]